MGVWSTNRAISNTLRIFHNTDWLLDRETIRKSAANSEKVLKLVEMKKQFSINPNEWFVYGTYWKKKQISFVTGLTLKFDVEYL